MRNLFGDAIEPIVAPFAGVVNYVIATPPVSEGEPLAMVSRVLGRTDQDPVLDCLQIQGGFRWKRK